MIIVRKKNLIRYRTESATKELSEEYFVLCLYLPPCVGNTLKKKFKGYNNHHHTDRDLW